MANMKGRRPGDNRQHGPRLRRHDGLLPIDEQTLAYLRETGRTDEEVELVERYAKEQNLFRSLHDANLPTPSYTKVLHLDLSTVEPSLAGPKRPQDRVPLCKMKENFRRALQAPIKERGFALTDEQVSRTVPVEGDDSFGHGSLVIASITSCTNTSNPGVMLAAGLLARNAVKRGLKVKPHVKTSLSPGSRVVSDYLREAGLDKPLEELGFYTVGYGCMTCIGNSGPLAPDVTTAINSGKLIAGSVLSGNRNFEGRVHPLAKANYLASPPLVVAFALAGKVDIDLTTEPLGTGSDGPVFLKDIWPTAEEVEEFRQKPSSRDVPHAIRRRVPPTPTRCGIRMVAESELFDWIRTAPTSKSRRSWSMPLEPSPIQPLVGARLCRAGRFGHDDHISPAGGIQPTVRRAEHIKSWGVARKISTAERGGATTAFWSEARSPNIPHPQPYRPGAPKAASPGTCPTASRCRFFDAAMKYRDKGVPTIILAGTEYGTGSSRDWAAKGPYLLGIRVVIAASFERIHRSNLVGMGILPLQLPEGQNMGVDRIDRRGGVRHSRLERLA